MTLVVFKRLFDDLDGTQTLSYDLGGTYDDLSGSLCPMTLVENSLCMMTLVVNILVRCL